MTELQLRADDLAWRMLEGRVVVLDLATSNYFATNRSAAVLWQALEGGATRDDLVGCLLRGFAVDRPEAERDVDVFLDELRTRGLVEARDGD